MSDPSSPPSLQRVLGLPGALMTGLGSMVGTGVFVSIGLAAGVAGNLVVPAIMLAALVAMCNGLSSAQLAAAHPVSGGTYEYGYRFLSPWLGFSAGWMFLCAKSASAATAALGFSGYLLHFLGIPDAVPLQLPALILVAVITALVLTGLRRSHWANVVIVSITLIALFSFLWVTSPLIDVKGHLQFSFTRSTGPGFLEGAALMFVAFTGYGRVATLGEEIRNPARNIPRAIVLVVLVTAGLYISVALAAVGTVGAEPLGEITRTSAAPLETILMNLQYPLVARVVGLGAITAMTGVLLNLILGLSRVVLAMGRRKDMPGCFAGVADGTPRAAVLGVGVLVGAIALTGRVDLSWSFSAFTVLVYYSLTNLAALSLPAEKRIFPRIFPIAGFGACVFLAFQVEPEFWATGLGILAAGCGWHFLCRHRAKTG